MDESVYLLEPVLGAEKLDKKFSLLLEACEEQQAFAEKPVNKIHEVIATINRRLNASATRRAGLLLLKTFLSQCSDDVFQDNAVHWMGQCLREALAPSGEETAYGVLRMVLRMSSNFQELTKPISSNVIPKLLEQLPRAQYKVAALQCLEVVLRYYGGPCKSNKGAIQKFILGFVQEEDPSVLHCASRCVSFLPLVGGGGSGATKHHTAWTQQLLQLCASVNKTLDHLYTNVTELHLTPILGELENESGIPLPVLRDESPVIAAHHHATILGNLLKFIEAMLSVELSMAKEIRPSILIALACRALAVNCTTLGKGASIERVALVSVLPRIHTAFLSLLRTLVFSCGNSLIRFGPLICKLVLQTLKWTATPAWGFGTERPYRRVREAACSLLESWLVRAQGAAFAEVLADHLVAQLLTDISQARTAVTLQVQSKKHLTKQQRRALAQQAQSQKQDSSIPSELSASSIKGTSRVHLADPCANAGLCQAALCALSSLVQAVGPLLKPTLHRQLQEAVLGLLLEIQQSGDPEDMPAPYSVSGCRLQLYRLLLTLTLHPHTHWPPPTQFSLTFFSSGQHDSALEVAGFCCGALASVRQMVHPSRSSSQFPVPLTTMCKSAGIPEAADRTLPKLDSLINSPTPNGNHERETEANVERKRKMEHVKSDVKAALEDSGDSVISVMSDSVEEITNTISESKKRKKRKRKERGQGNGSVVSNGAEDSDSSQDTSFSQNVDVESNISERFPQKSKREKISKEIISPSNEESPQTSSKKRFSVSPVEVIIDSSNDSHSPPGYAIGNVVEVDLNRSDSNNSVDVTETEETKEPVVDLADSGSDTFSLCLDADDGVSIVEVASEPQASPKSDIQGNQPCEEPEKTASESTKGVADLSFASDRELEDSTVDMEAVNEETEITIEESEQKSEGEPAAKKARVEKNDDTGAKDSDVDEEEILSSFVDLVASEPANP